MFECFICREQREDSWICDECKHEVCLYCFEQVIRTNTIKCPYCRKPIEENKAELGFGLPVSELLFYSLIPDIRPPQELEGDIEEENLDLNHSDYQFIREFIHSVQPAVQAINELLSERLPTASNNLEN